MEIHPLISRVFKQYMYKLDVLQMQACRRTGLQTFLTFRKLYVFATHRYKL